MALPDLIDSTPRVRLAHLPTPLQTMDRLRAHLGHGPRLWVKRDDLTGIGMGGNKVRKLEFVVADALAAGADVLVTAGVPQSNSVRQVAASAAKAGLGCHVVTMEDRTPDVDTSPDTGNALLIRLFGATTSQVGWTGDRTAAIGEAADRLAAEGRRPYVVPYGVSNPLGALGYSAAAMEMVDQFEALGIAPRAVVHASGSGGTQAGLVVGFHGTGVDIIGVDVDAEPERVEADVTAIAAGLAAEVGLPGEALAIEVLGGFAGPHYGSVTEDTLEAIDLAARLEGLVLDPVYSAKAMTALIGLIRNERFSAGDDVVFIHTGGEASLFARPGVVRQVERRRR